MEKRLKGWAQSSVDPKKLSTTITGAIIAFSGIIIGIFKYFGVEIGSDEISVFASQLGIGVGAVWTIAGLVRKVVMRFGTEKDE